MNKQFKKNTEIKQASPEFPDPLKERLLADDWHYDFKDERHGYYKSTPKVDFRLQLCRISSSGPKRWIYELTGYWVGEPLDEGLTWWGTFLEDDYSRPTKYILKLITLKREWDKIFHPDE